MYRGTTPTLTLKVNTTLDLTKASQIWVTLRSVPPTSMLPHNENEAITLDINRLSFNSDGDILLNLTQEETLHFKEGKVEAQLRVVIDDKAYASAIANFNAYNLLKDGVIS